MQINGKQIKGASIPNSKLVTPAAFLTEDDKNRASAVTAGDNQTTGLTITHTPAQGSYIGIFVNGILQVLGDASKVKDCYFSVDGGATARDILAIVAGDTLYWNGVLTGYNLDATDFIDMNYLV